MLERPRPTARTTKNTTSTVNITALLFAKYSGFSFVRESTTTRFLFTFDRSLLRIEGLFLLLLYLIPLFIFVNILILLSHLLYIENGPSTMKGKKASTVSKNVMTNNTEINNGPCVLIGSIASFLSLSVNEPAIASINISGGYLPRNMTIAVDQFQNGVLAEVPK